MLNVKRKISQLVFLVILGEFSFYGIFRCPFAVPYTECGSCPVVQCPGKKLWLSFWIILPIALLLFGRGFCSWACPGGLFSELLSKVSLFKGKINRNAERLKNLARDLTEISRLESGEAEMTFQPFDLREVLDCLGRIIGDTVTDDIVKDIFSRFCIGK